MKKTLITALLLTFTFSFPVYANEGIESSCEDALPEDASVEEREALKAECMEMENQYLSENSEYTDCYAEVDNYIANNYDANPSVADQYESLLDACLAKQAQD